MTLDNRPGMYASRILGCDVRLYNSNMKLLYIGQNITETLSSYTFASKDFTMTAASLTTVIQYVNFKLDWFSMY